MGGGSGSTSTSSSKSGPPGYVKPYAQQQTNIATGLFGGQNYPTQQTAGFTPDQLAAMGLTEQLTPQQQAYLGQAQGANAGLIAGTPAINQGLGALTGIAGGQNPYMQQAGGALGGIASGQNPYMQQAGGAASSLLNDPTVAAAQQANQAIASGANLNAANNPALQSYISAGLQPMVSEYQQAVAPNILSNAVTSGGLGSSGTEQAFSNAQQALASQMGDYTAQVVEPAYEAGLGQQEQAIANTTGLLAPKESGINALQGLSGQQANAASGLGSLAGQQASAAGQIPGMYNPQQTAISQAGGLSQQAYDPASQLMGIGTQQQQQTQNVLNTIFGNQMMPYQMSQMGANLISALGGGGGQSFQVASQPGSGSMK